MLHVITKTYIYEYTYNMCGPVRSYIWPILLAVVENILKFSYYNCKTNVHKSHTSFVISFAHTLQWTSLITLKLCDYIIFLECRLAK